jgi:hypothetical protein
MTSKSISSNLRPFISNRDSATWALEHEGILRVQLYTQWQSILATHTIEEEKTAYCLPEEYTLAESEKHLSCDWLDCTFKLHLRSLWSVNIP